MKEFIKRNYTLVLAFLIPIAFVAVVALSTYLPSAFLSTNYDFVYATCSNGTDYYSYGCDGYLEGRYSVTEGRLVLNEIDPDQDSDRDGVQDINENHHVHLFFHDPDTNESKEITLEEAQALRFSGLLTSPDGVTVSDHYDRGSDLLFIFDGGYSSYGYYLTKGESRKELSLIHNGDGSYRDNFAFIGWILED